MKQRGASLGSVALRPGEGEALWAFGGLLIFKATAEQTGGEFVLAELVLRRGTATPLHATSAGSLYVLDGRLTVYRGREKPMPASAGSFVYVPRGVPHAYRVESETARLLWLTPAQHESFFRAAGEPAPARTLPPLDDPGAGTLIAHPNVNRSDVRIEIDDTISRAMPGSHASG